MSANRRGFLRNLANITGVATVAGMVAGVTNQYVRGETLPLRPPGALPEEDFLSTCIRCMRCTDACPNHCIEAVPSSEGRSDAGTPCIQPRKQACMLCSRIDGEFLRCTEVCPTGALQPIRKTLEDIRDKVRMGVAVVDFNLCYSYNNYTCGTCYHACPLNDLALKVGLWERPEVIAEACVGCGLCERSCIRYPQAIRVQPIDRPDLRGKSREGEAPAEPKHEQAMAQRELRPPLSSNEEVPA